MDIGKIRVSLGIEFRSGPVVGEREISDKERGLNKKNQIAIWAARGQTPAITNDEAENRKGSSKILKC